MAMSRTVTQDVSRQVNEAVWDANADAMEGMVYLFTTALDSRTCETCAPLDNTRYTSSAMRLRLRYTPIAGARYCPLTRGSVLGRPTRNGQQIREEYRSKQAHPAERGEGSSKTQVIT